MGLGQLGSVGQPRASRVTELQCHSSLGARLKPLYLFDVASAQGRWLRARQALVSENVANANTPGFRAKDLEPFAEVLQTTGLALTRTNSRHLTETSGAGAPGYAVVEQEGDANHTGNTVSIEQELAKSGEVRSRYSLGVNVMGSFHRMLMASTRG